MTLWIVCEKGNGCGTNTRAEFRERDFGIWDEARVKARAKAKELSLKEPATVFQVRACDEGDCPLFYEYKNGEVV